MNKKWLILGTISFSVGLSLSLAINRSIKQAALTGLLSIPATVSGVSVIEHQRKQKLNEKISTQQGQLQNLVRQEAELNNSVSLLFNRVESLKQQEEDIKAVISAVDVDKQRCLQLATQSQSELETIQNQIYELSNRKSSLEPEIITLEVKLRQLKEQETALTKLLADLSNFRQQIETNIESNRHTHQQLQEQKFNLEENINNLAKQKQTLAEQLNSQQHSLNQLHQQKLDLENAIATIYSHKQELERQFQEQVVNQEAQKVQLAWELGKLRVQEVEFQKTNSQLNLEIEQLQQQTDALNQSIAILNQEKQEIESQIEALRTTLSELQNLVLKQQQLSKQNKFELKAEIEQLQQQKVELDLALTSLRLEKQDIESNCTTSQTQLTQLQNLVLEQQQLKEELANLLTNLEQQKQELITQIQQLQSQIVIETIEVKKTSEIEEIVNKSDSKQIISVNLDNNNYDFRNAKYTKDLWETTILPYWNHGERPAGYRFLGNVTIESNQSDRIIDIVGENLQRLDRITDNSLQQSFSALEKDWIKIITFALSEYAYYYSDERFWEGFCDRINIEHSQTVENTLRQITEQGINLLGLIKASEGYKYVSTLWLQSGVPKQNMSHFATIVQDVADEYGWWEISHSSALDIAEILWQFWQNKYNQWGTIKHFLKLDRSNEYLEPLSGQLVKSIAIIARELQRKDIAPEQLQNQEIQEDILGYSNLSYSFFLRDWSDLITVLTPRSGKSDRSITKRRNQLPYLYFDFDTSNILLILPEQSIWKNEWRDLRGTYCKIPEANWEGNIPNQGNLEISELEVTVTQAVEKWTCQLQNYHRNQIHQWEHEGINSEFSCLVFNAISGEHIKIDISQPNIIGIEEIILFTPKEIEIELDRDNIEEIDNLLPSSIKGWRGKEIKLIKSQASIAIQNIEVNWQLREQEQPQLIGLRLKDRKVVYLNAPTLYYPPQEQDITVKYSIERIDLKETITRDSLTLLASDIWSEINLSQWIAEAGNYQAEFWQQEKSWSYRFEVREEYKITQEIAYRALEIYNRDNNHLSIPAKYDNINRFWAEEIKIDNVYPLEELAFRLKSDSEEYIFPIQADSSGKLTLSLASLYGYLPKSDRYTLDIKQSGSEFRRILQVGYFISWQLTATEVTFTGLPSKDNYYLSGWNLLNPNKESETINFSLLDLDQGTVNLCFSPGIYHIQLYQEQQLIENIGLWSGIDPQNIPEEINNDEVLANYCYTILGNESSDEFSDAFKQINTNFEREKIQIILDDLHKENCFLSEWLDKDSLTNKLQKILEILLVSSSVNSVEQKSNTGNMEITNQPTTISGQWCLVTVRQWKRETFLRYLDNDIQRKQLQELILEIIAPEESVYQDMVLIQISNFSEARNHLQQIEHFQSIQRLRPHEVSQMLNR